jgi:hypothetical protein
MPRGAGKTSEGCTSRCSPEKLEAQDVEILRFL